MHEVVKDRAGRFCIVVHACCACGRWVQQEFLYYVPLPTVVRCPHKAQEKCKVWCPQRGQAKTHEN